MRQRIPQDFYIAHYAKYIGDDHCARDLPRDAWVSINIRLCGGGKRARGAKKKDEEEDAAAASSDDIEVTETFDEVQFGDGDESHQIYTNMSGIIITWNTCAEDTFKVFREEVCDMFGVDPLDFYIAYHAKYIKDEHCARDLPNGAWISTNFRCHGGGKRAASSTTKSSAGKSAQDKEKSKKLMLIKIENGAKKFVPTGVDYD
ncbi:MAG: hypothetical protein ACKPKO_29130, partial [Candidatus Fonsibacter sp.]